MTWAELSGLKPGSRIYQATDPYDVITVRTSGDPTFGKGCSVLMYWTTGPAGCRRRVPFKQLLNQEWQLQPFCPESAARQTARRRARRPQPLAEIRL